MKAKFLIVGYNAIESMVGHRKLQSIDYEESNVLIDFLLEITSDKTLWDLRLSSNDEGLYIFTKNDSKKKGVIFDLTRLTIFDLKTKRSDLLTVIQKLLRLSIRFFLKQPYTPTEKLVDDNLLILFPFSYSGQDNYRIAIDRKPDDNKRANRGDYLYIFADGHLSNFQKPESYSLFKKALRSLNTVDNEAVNNDSPTSISAIKVVNLEENQNLSIDATIGIDKWQYYLTEVQKQFVTRPVCGPERLEGAAGTGKTLTLILRAITVLQNSIANEIPNDILFLTHSIATKKQIENILIANWPDAVNHFDRTHSAVSIEVTTLQELSLRHLESGISSSEYLDRDAQDSKDYQLIIIDESYEEAWRDDYPTYRDLCSDRFNSFIKDVSREELLEMLQHEIAVSIKGRANESIERYRKLERFKHSIPVEGEDDLNFLFLIYSKYQGRLSRTGQFDSDDIVLTTMGRLNTPIWRRRKVNEGYDILFIDETHLFNFNELGLLHHLTKKDSDKNIIFAIDKSQAIGDRGLTDVSLYDSLGIELVDSNGSAQRLKTVFRSSPDIVNVAFEILSSGTTLFTNFENPMDKVEFSFTAEEEKKSRKPQYVLKENEEAMVSEAYTQAEQLCKDLNCKKSRILIVATSPKLLTSLESYGNSVNKPFELLKNRGDAEVVRSAEKSNRFVIAGIDYVGGLEFDGAIVLGVDKNRVPPVESEDCIDSFHFLSYAWHNRMYVAVTRAKYALVLIGEKSRGISELLESAVKKKILELM